MNVPKIVCVGLFASLAITAISRTQTVPTAPGVPAAPAAPANLWSFLLPNADQTAACKLHFCNSAVGKLVNGAAGPMSAMTGGLMGNRCAQSNIADAMKNKAADDPEGAAARVKKDEAEAKVRRAAVRFLGTVDCNYWPEAIDALKTALRKDRNECVRFEAALALRNGCCCNNEIIDALKQSIMGESKTDPNPAERSERVRAAAADALARCPMVQDPKTDEKLLTSNPTPSLPPADYYKKVAAMPQEEVAASARAVLTSMKQGGKAQTTSTGTGNGPHTPEVAPIPVRATSVSGIFANAFASGSFGTSAREPFFSNLTRTLTGAQEHGVPALPTMIPGGSGIIPPQEKKPAPLTELPRSISFIDPPADLPRLINTSAEVSAPAPGVQLAAYQARREVPAMAIRLTGPNQAALGQAVVFEVQIANKSSQPLTKIILYGWLPEELTHTAGAEIKGEVSTTIAPGESKMLRLSTSAIKPGRGTVRIKVETDAGEVTTTAPIEITAPTLSQTQSTLSFLGGKDQPAPEVLTRVAQ